MKARAWTCPDGWSGDSGALSGNGALPSRSVAGGTGVFGSRTAGLRASYGIPVDDRHPQAFFRRIVGHTVRFQLLAVYDQPQAVAQHDLLPGQIVNGAGTVQTYAPPRVRVVQVGEYPGSVIHAAFLVVYPFRAGLGTVGVSRSLA